jgi:putative RNA 2'-phosphotransferase
MNKQEYKLISKTISHALRHDPNRYGLVLDDNGFVSIELLIEVLRKYEQKWSNISYDDIVQVVNAFDKKRHEIVGKKIRALYGHSSVSISDYVPMKPPDILFHGTSRTNVENIIRNGLLAMTRKYVHLSTELSIALSTGERKDKEPAIFKIDALRAYLAGINFYGGNNDIWLADRVPSQFICLQPPSIKHQWN